ncbi:7SK snRNA methylphosphate capping enzyme [Amia ocellicauda]|uniref:7SK snRNA methylphosphate capping enzyme n=1 Tax=Amia ocellicauda TaxID=2972642 RepID=UPI003463B63B
MIEMSGEKEAALTGEGKGPVPLPAPHTAGTATPNPSTTTTTATVAAAILTPPYSGAANSAKADCAPTENAGLGGRVGSSFRPKNGLQPPPPQQKPYKRRSSMNTGFKHPGFSKRRRRANSESDPVLPTNFLLGGNIFDPLNLNSLLDEEVNRALNAETPKSSPLPAKSRDPVEILIPKDITDPLNLNCAGGETGPLVSPRKAGGGGGRKRHRHRHHGGGGAGGATAAAAAPSDPSEVPGKAGPAIEGEAAAEVSVTALLSETGAPPPVVPETAREGASSAAPSSSSSAPAPLSLAPVPESPQPYELNTSINCRDEVVPPILPPRRSASSAPARSQPDLPSSSTTTASSLPPSSGGGAPCGTAPSLSSSAVRHRKRRRTSSKSDSSCPTLPPATPATGGKKAAPEKGRAARQPQAFLTPCTSGGGVASSCPTGAPYAAGSGVRGQPRRRQKGKFQYGNYNKYYGYRNPGWSEDPRVRWLRPEWFQGKAVLDLGCNTGHLTLAIAKNWRPACIVGLDIDPALIHAARQNVRHYLSDVAAEEAREQERRRREGEGAVAVKEEEAEQMQQTGEGEEAGKADESAGPLQPESEQPPAEKRAEGPAAREEGMEGEDAQKEGGERTEAVVCPAPSPSPVVKQQFPVSLRICRGPIAAPPLAQADASCPGDFPANVSFVTGNYVLQSDGALQAQQPEFDTILCLSVTKWVHLNWGDPGLQRLFQRAFRQLRPGGVFILEPQPWTSYGKRKKLTDAIYKNYYSIRLKPEQFSSYLTSPEVGFSSYELVGTPKTSSRGFQRPIYLFHKGPPSCRK